MHCSFGWFFCGLHHQYIGGIDIVIVIGSIYYYYCYLHLSHVDVIKFDGVVIIITRILVRSPLSNSFYLRMWCIYDTCENIRWHVWRQRRCLSSVLFSCLYIYNINVIFVGVLVDVDVVGMAVVMCAFRCGWFKWKWALRNLRIIDILWVSKCIYVNVVMLCIHIDAFAYIYTQMRIRNSNANVTPHWNGNERVHTRSQYNDYVWTNEKECVECVCVCVCSKCLCSLNLQRERQRYTHTYEMNTHVMCDENQPSENNSI